MDSSSSSNELFAWISISPYFCLLTRLVSAQSLLAFCELIYAQYIPCELIYKSCGMGIFYSTMFLIMSTSPSFLPAWYLYPYLSLLLFSFCCLFIVLWVLCVEIGNVDGRWCGRGRQRREGEQDRHSNWLKARSILNIEKLRVSQADYIHTDTVHTVMSVWV